MWNSLKRYSSTTLFHRTSVSSSVIFGDPYYGPKDLLYTKSTTQPRLRYVLHPKSTTLPPRVLANNWYSSVSTHSSPPLQGSQSHQFPACTLQRTNPPASSLRAILQHPTSAAASPRVRHSPDDDQIPIKTSSCNFQFFFRTNYYSIERISHGVTASCLYFTYLPHHAKLQVLPSLQSEWKQIHVYTRVHIQSNRKCVYVL